MLRAAACFIAIICLSISCAEVKKVHQFGPSPNAIPKLNIINDTTATAMEISMLNINTVVAANIATTTFDVRFHNPNDKILEGEFEFPLADGQAITRYALDMNGSLREGVVVEKAKARIAFEATVRKGIDPGLVEKTKGNNFRTRIFPIPANGYRRILIAVEQTLEQDSKDLLYQLPLHAEKPIDSFSLKITVIKSQREPQVDENGIAHLKFRKQKDNYVAEYQSNNFQPNQNVAFALPAAADSDALLIENNEGQTYFYVNSRIEPEHKDKKKPSSIGVFWDISSSADKRDLKKEQDLLAKYIASLGNVSVSLIPFNIYTQTKEDFGNNTENLLKRLAALEYDGGTQLGAIDLTKYNFDEIILFSDGLSTFGKEEMILSGTPVLTVTSSPSANYSYLKYIAQQTHGQFIDLGKFQTSAALQQLEGQSLQVVNISYDHSEIEDLAMQTTPILNTGLSFAGKLKTSVADIKVSLGFGSEVVTTKRFAIKKNGDSDYDQVKRIWATMKINQLDMEFEKNKKEITQLGKKFSVVTQNTSLLVLDRIEDYVEHEIVPPVELQKEYFALLEKKQAEEMDKKDLAFNEALGAMENLKEWWNKKFNILQKPLAQIADDSQVARERRARFTYMVANEETFEASPGTYNTEIDSVRFQLDSTTSGSGLGLTGEVGVQFNAVTTAVPFTRINSDANRLNGAFDLRYGRINSDADGENDTFGWGSGDHKKSAEDKADIDLKEWKPDVAYLKTLERSAAQERKNQYLSLKKQYRSQPSFFVDVARFFMEKNDKEFGVLVLSNISEMKLEDAKLLRIVANQLMDAGEKELAIVTFEQILKMREEDPQSYRDLALAYNETGNYDKAVELLHRLVTGSWDSRFGDVKSIALNEMNAIISAHPGLPYAQGIDKRLIYAMPVDVRIVIGWSSDNSDIDLWVTDPNKEKCFYQHTETVIGGKISRDVTQGYGPEEFSLKKAKGGNYVVDVNLYGDHRQTLGGPISIHADLFTDFGRPTQKRKTINFRVTSNKEVINLGSLRFGS